MGKENEIAKKEEESRGVQPIIKINSLTIGKAEKENVVLGNTPSFLSYIGNAKIREILWNEEYLLARTDDKNELIAYKPELEPTSQMFFTREEKKNESMFGGNGLRVWEGDYAPIEFTKGNMIKFLKAHANQVPQETLDSIKNLRITEKHTQHEEMIDLGNGELDDENVRTVDEQTAITNIPSKFVLHLPLFDGYSADFNFEAKVAKSDDSDWHSPNKGKKVIQLRVLNAREVLKGIMLDVISKLPENIPKYYGRLQIREAKLGY